MLDTWRGETGSRLIVASALVRHRVLAGEVARRGTILGGTVDTMERLWRDVGSRTEVPTPLDDIELRAEVIAALADPSLPPILSALRTRTADVNQLIAHLKALDDAGVDPYRPQTPVESGIADLRALLHRRGVVSRARFRGLTAEAAQRLTYDRPLLVAPPSAIRPTTGRLLMALAEHCSVTLFLAIGPEGRDLLLNQLGVTETGPDDRTIEDAWPPPTIRGIDADDEVEVAVEQAAEWAENGTPLEHIAICVPLSADGDAAVQAAARRGLSVVAPRGAAMRDSLVGTVIERLALTLDAAAADPTRRDEILADLADDSDALSLGLTRDDVTLVEASRANGTIAEAEALHNCGLRLADHVYRAHGGTPDDLGPQVRQAFLWLDALQTQIDTLRMHDVDAPPYAHLILAESVAVPRPRGATGGVTIVRPSEVASLGVTHVVMTGLSAGSLPRPPAASPFTSRELQDAVPGLRPRDEHTDLQAICATARDALTMVRQSQGADGIERDPSPWFSEVLGGVVPEPVSVRDGAGRRRRLQGRARTGHRDPGPVAEALDALDRHRRPATFPGQPKSRISVTTLEEYLRCPLGWMVGRHMGPWSRGSVNLHMGNVADEALGMALTLGGEHPVQDAPLDKRVAAAMAAIHPHPAWPMVPREKRDMLEGWIEATARKYYDPEYMNEIAPGWRPVAAQMWLRSSNIVEGFTISGVADRVDVTDRGVLVIDWKLQRTIQIPDTTKRRDELQKGLYPYMAAGDPRSGLPREILGFLYVSVAHQDHVGSTTKPVGGGGEVDQEWVADNKRAVERATLACHGIQNKDVWGTGETCDAPWCGHQYISTTAWSTT